MRMEDIVETVWSKEDFCKELYKPSGKVVFTSMELTILSNWQQELRGEHDAICQRLERNEITEIECISMIRSLCAKAYTELFDKIDQNKLSVEFDGSLSEILASPLG